MFEANFDGINTIRPAAVEWIIDRHCKGQHPALEFPQD
jgi:hypothetical protein